MTEETRNCKRCDGTGRSAYADRKCYACDGRGTFAPPDTAGILAAIKGRKGLCSKRPADGRAYYVWRMARFHGGVDVTMPMMAALDVAGDPWTAELDAISDAVAKRVYGTDLAAAHRWGRALGHLDRDMPGLPDSAYSGGRIADMDKPIEEQAELF